MNPIHLREMPENIPEKPLTVGEIIQLLIQVDSNMPLLIEGYESGATTVFRISQSVIKSLELAHTQAVMSENDYDRRVAQIRSQYISKINQMSNPGNNALI